MNEPADRSAVNVDLDLDSARKPGQVPESCFDETTLRDFELQIYAIPSKGKRSLGLIGIMSTQTKLVLAVKNSHGSSSDGLSENWAPVLDLMRSTLETGPIRLKTHNCRGEYEMGWLGKPW